MAAAAPQLSDWQKGFVQRRLSSSDAQLGVLRPWHIRKPPRTHPGHCSDLPVSGSGQPGAGPTHDHLQGTGLEHLPKIP
jgi:hypothetical protein